jgi:ketol-acid reductoisomerase
VDVIMVAPKGSGLNVRRNFLSGAGINSSFAVEQDATGRAKDRAGLGIGIGSGYLFPTTFEQEVTSDLTGERGVLMGALAGIMDAQYDVLRANGHSPSEAFNETVEELTQSLIRLVDENGMDWMYSNCSATAQRGALDWRPRFKQAVMPVFELLYDRVFSHPALRPLCPLWLNPSSASPQVVARVEHHRADRAHQHRQDPSRGRAHAHARIGDDRFAAAAAGARDL